MLDAIEAAISSIDISDIITVVVALAGWFAVHRLTAWRERAGLHRKIKTDFLIKAYQDLANSSQRNPDAIYFRAMESAIADIQLFGSKQHIELAEAFLSEFAKENLASFDPLMNALRSDLRKELGYEHIEGNVRWFRPEGAPIGHAPQGNQAKVY